MKRRRAVAAAGVVVLLITIAAYLGVSFVVADRFSRIERIPVDRGPHVTATSYEDVTLSTSDGVRLSGWFFPATGVRAVVLIHGRDQNRTEWRERDERIASFLVAAGYAVLMFDLRGHGNSESDPRVGERYTLGFLERHDVDAGVAFLRGRGYADARIALLGVSMGAASALGELTLDPNVGPIVLDSSFEDAGMELAEQLPSQAGVPGWIAPGVLLVFRVAFGVDTEAVRPIDIVRAHPERPFLFIQCDQDDLINVHHGRDLRGASANAASDLWIAPGCLHARASDDHPDEYRTRVLAFLAAQMR